MTSGRGMVRFFLLTVFFSLRVGRTTLFCRTIPFATCVVPFPETVSSSKSLLSQTIVVNMFALITFRGIVISFLAPSLLAMANAVSCR